MQLRMPYFFPFEGVENIVFVLVEWGQKKDFQHWL